MVRLLVKKSIDINMYPVVSSRESQYIITYPITYSQYYIATYNSDNLSPLTLLSNFNGSIVIIIIIITTLIIIGAIVLILIGIKRFNDDQSTTIMNQKSIFFRLIYIKNLRIHRIFLLIFLYFLLLRIIYQNHLTKLLTNQYHAREIDSLHDLINNNDIKKIYGEYHMNPFHQFIPASKKVPGSRNCTHKNKNENLRETSCFSSYENILRYAVKNDLRLSKYPVGQQNYFFEIRRDWPLKHRVNILSMWIDQAGLTIKWYKERHRNENIYHKMITDRIKLHFKAIDFPEIEYAFIILAFGLITATLLIAGEITIERRKLLKRYNRRPLLIVVPIPLRLI